jgi:multimeric flavodoxin WrbA
MNVLVLNGSPRKNGNTERLLSHVIAGIEEGSKAEGLSAPVVVREQIGGRLIHGCTACFACSRNSNMRCIQEDDCVNDIVAKMAVADAILIGSPTYFADLTPETKAIIDRCGFVVGGNGDFLRRKIGAAVVAVRRAGGIHAFDSINHFFLIKGMIVPGSTYWNIGVARDIGDADRDEEGVRTMKNLGLQIAWLHAKLAGK